MSCSELQHGNRLRGFALKMPAKYEDIHVHPLLNNIIMESLNRIALCV